MIGQTRTNLRAYFAFLSVGILAVSVLLAAQQRKQPAAQTILGYTARRAVEQRKLEARFAAIPSSEEARKHHRYFTAEPHPAGSERNNELARHIAAQQSVEAE